MNDTIEDQLIEKLDKIRQKVGGTPLVELSKFSRNKKVKIFAKKEGEQIGGSVKARAAFFIIKNAIETGALTRAKSFLDASSGNTAIAYANILKELEIQLTVVLPENASEERKTILQELGAQLILSSPFDGTDGAQVLAKELFESHPLKYYYADQYNNEFNWKSHYSTTALEIFKETNGEITHFAASLGTTGTFVGTGRRLKELKKNIKLVQLQPDLPMHGLEGWKHLETAKIPGIFDHELADSSIEINSEKAHEILVLIYEKTGLRLSPSAAASVLGTIKLSERINEGVIVTTLADNGDKYGEIYKKLGI